MSLGIKLLGRAQSWSVIGSGISLVPRGPPICSCAPTARSSGRHRSPFHSYSTATGHDHGETATVSAGAAVSGPAPTDTPSDDHSSTSAIALSRPGAQAIAAEEVDSLISVAEMSLKDKIDPFVTPNTKMSKPEQTRVKVSRDSILEPVAMRYPNQKETASSLSRYFNKMFQKVRVEELQAKHELKLPDWRLNLNVLRKRTPLATWDTPSNSRVLTISEEVADMLLHEVDKTLWDIARKTDCDLVLRKTPTKNATNNTSCAATVVLSGSDGAIDSAKSEILQSAAGITSSEPVVPLDIVQGQPPMDVTSDDRSVMVWSSLQKSDRPSHRRNYYWGKKYEKIKEPQVWTKQTLEKYLLAITAAQVSARRKTAYYGSGTNARAAAISLLERQLLAEETRSALSTRAFTIALEFIAKSGSSFRPTTRRLFQRMADAGVPMNTSVFNILLSSNAQAGDLMSFQILLQRMTTRGFLPNLGTWKCFLDFIEDKEVKQHIFRSMNDRGLLKDYKGRQVVAYHLITYDLEQARSRWEGIGPFLESQSQRYGPDWMGGRSVDAIMNELGRMGKLASCIHFLDFVRQQPNGPVPTTATLNILLNHAKSHQDRDLALVALARFHNTGTAFDDTTYHELFALFFRMRDANALSVVWRLACMEGKTSYKMRARVSEIYDKCPFLVSPDIPMPGLGFSHPGMRLSTSVRTTGRFWTIPHLPTLHHPDMYPQLVKIQSGPGPRDAGPGDAEAEQKQILRLVPSIGSRIATMFRQRWPTRKWHRAPLHALVAEALGADRILHEEAKKSRQIAEMSAPDTGYADLDPEIPTNVERRTAPGIPILVVRRRPGDKLQGSQTEQAEAASDVAEDANEEPGDNSQAIPQPEPQASADGEEPAHRPDVVVDVGPIIFSRTYGVSRDLLQEGTVPPESREA